MEREILFMQVFAFYYNRHLEVLFTRPQSMDNMRKSKSIFPLDLRLTLKIRLSIIHMKCRFAFDKVVPWHWKQIALLASMSVCLPTLMQGLSETVESRWIIFGNPHLNETKIFWTADSDVWWCKQILLHTVRSQSIRLHLILVLKISL